MYQNRFWLFFLTLLSLCATVCGVQAVTSILAYKRLSIHIPVEVIEWKIEERKQSAYAVIANYYFEYEGKTYHGSSLVHAVYKNPWAAQKAQISFEKLRWQAWIDPDKPIYSMIYKRFPIKYILSALVLLGVSAYFLCIQFFLRGKHGYRAY